MANLAGPLKMTAGFFARRPLAYRPDFCQSPAVSVRLLAACLPPLLAGTVAAEPFTPNQPDAHTLHLWHLDEAAPPMADQAAPPQPLAGAANGALPGQASAPGLGSAVSFRANAGGIPGKSDLAGAILTARPTLDQGPRDNVPPGFAYFGPDGAFTYELVVKFDFLPSEAGAIACGLITMEGDDKDRIFNFRVEKEGFLSFLPLPHGGATGLGLATIPTSGPHAIDTEHWFHLAVTYDGHDGATNNLRFYWTRLGPGLTRANPIGGGTLSGDLNGTTGDFAIGNEARTFEQNAEAEPFPGLIDEVRISSIARHPTDFFFVPPALRTGPDRAAADRPRGPAPGKAELTLSNVLVDASSTRIPTAPDGILRLSSGLHRLDFDFGFGTDPPDGDSKLRCQLEGVDERWQETEVGMSLLCEALDAENRVISQAGFPFAGRSPGWESTLEDSTLTRRIEPVFLPAGTTALRLSLSSGSPDTTGFVMIDRLSLTVPGGDRPSLWQRGRVAAEENTSRAAGAPESWRRDGSDPAIARLVLRDEGPLLGLADGDQAKHGEWSSVQRITPPGGRGATLMLAWDEAYNVIGGGLHRATYVNVPPGRYVFRAIGLTRGDRPAGDGISLTILIEPPVWRRPWFGPLLAATAVALLASALFARHRRRSKHRLEVLRYQNALEQDRTRIARDLHDDLGTRVTVLNMTAALARRDLASDPDKARRHLDKMDEAARELVEAMDDLVWAVDPAHDTLDHLASHLVRLADEMFRDSPVRCRLDIPSMLPARPLGADFRHHIALAVKESLHNVLQHAGPCEVHLTLRYDGSSLVITIRDNGRGFDLASHPTGHGLGNTAARIREIGGTCVLDSSPDRGTSTVITCPLPDTPP
jgi:signal transduction histidine kinase